MFFGFPMSVGAPDDLFDLIGAYRFAGCFVSDK